MGLLQLIVAMPRYRFSWLNIPQSLLAELADAMDLDRGDDVAEELRAIYGARPQESFIEDTWELLREVWLVEDDQSRSEIVATLRERGLGEMSLRDDLEYLRSCRNTINLRRVVLPTFISLGESGSSIVAEPARDTDQPLPKKSANSGGNVRAESGGLPKASQSGGLPKSSSGKGGGGLSDSDSDDDSDDSPDSADGAANKVEHFRQWLLKNVREITNKEDLEVDDDGDIPVDVGSARTYLSPREIRVTPKHQALAVEIYSVLLSEVNQSPKLLETLNRMNCETPFAKLKYHTQERHVVLHHEAFAHALNPERLAAHLQMIAFMADAVDTVLQREFGGELHGQDRRPDIQDV